MTSTLRPITNILVPVDDSSAARRALQEAGRLAKAFDATVTVIHIADLSQSNWGAIEFSDNRTLHAAISAIREEILQRAADTLNAIGVKHEVAVIESAGEKTADLLINEAEARQADYIVMGTHGFSGLMHLLMGSVAEGVVRQAKIPVLLVRDSED